MTVDPFSLELAWLYFLSFLGVSEEPYFGTTISALDIRH